MAVSPIREISITAAVIPLILLGGCTRSINWTEEVPLNTGETIVVHRRGSVSFGSASGNPLELGYFEDPVKAIEFEYRGSRYFYRTEGALQLLAISPDGSPNLVISAADIQWQWHHDYRCVRPSYVQLRPDPGGKGWTWRDRIDPWLYGLPTNLYFGLPERNWVPRTVTVAEREKAHAMVYLWGEHLRRIEPSFQHADCKRKG